MTAYIEYVFLENFILDGLLLYGSCRFTKTPARYSRLCLSAGVGAIYALLSPFIRLPAFWNWVLKICVGAGLCLLAFGRIRNRKDGGRYAFFFASFLLFTFVVAGFLLTVWQSLTAKPPFIVVLIVIAVGIAVVEIVFERYKRKRELHTYIYECLVVGECAQARAQGYLDSGNLVKKNGLPVCFVSPLVFFKAFGGLDYGGERALVSTVSGEREMLLVKGKIGVKIGRKEREKEVYFSPSKNMLFREYEIILPACIIEER